MKCIPFERYRSGPRHDESYNIYAYGCHDKETFLRVVREMRNTFTPAWRIAELTPADVYYTRIDGRVATGVRP